MSITYDAQIPANFSTWIVSLGQLVRIKQNCFEQTGVFGIIIGCEHPDFGLGLNETWTVLVDGKINKIESFKIWPVEENI
jgi:hypothetical protein